MCSLRDFDASWTLSAEIGHGAQGKIYETLRRTTTTTKVLCESGSFSNLRHREARPTQRFATKIIFVSADRAERLAGCYRFAAQSKLLKIYGIYHDAEQRQLRVVMERFAHELSAQCLSVTRWCRPGMIQLDCPGEGSLRMFAEQITKQLARIHGAKRIHFDVKPQNIMFSAATTRWQLIDYDLMECVCSDVGGQSDCISVDHYRGTPSWTSPEMSTRGSRERPSRITPKTDIFSLGLVVLFVVEGGDQPFLLRTEDFERVHCKELTRSAKWRRDRVYFDKVLRGGNGNAFLQRHLWALCRRHLISEPLRLLLSGMLQFDVEARFDAEEVLSHCWFSGDGQCD